MKALLKRLLSPTVRIGLGLVSLMLTLLLVGEVFTGYPADRVAAVREHRVLVATMLARQVASQIRSDQGEGGDDAQRLLAHVRQLDTSLLSASVVAVSGQIVAQVGAHPEHWRLGAREPSNPDNIRIPLMAGSVPWGEVQLAFRPVMPTTLAGWLRDPMVHWLVFIALVGVLVFALYLRRVLRHLDPNAAVPERVRAAFDTLTEGVLVLDPAGRIMLANRAFSNLHGDDARALTGGDAGEMQWLVRALPAEHRSVLPWRQAVRTKKALLGVPLTLDAPGHVSRKLVLNCAPIHDGDNRARGCLASFSDVTELHQQTERLQIALAELGASQAEITRKNEELTVLATRDALTGIFNRRSLVQQAEQRFAQAQANGTPISCIMCDIDHFKLVNDKYGHAGGDQVIQGAAKALTRGLRLGDFVGRYGGEEFCIMLPGGTLAQACEVAERLREDIDANLGASLRAHVGVRVTMSFGVAQIAADVPDPATLIDLADQALYHSKKNGRNRVTPWVAAAFAAAEGQG